MELSIINSAASKFKALPPISQAIKIKIIIYLFFFFFLPSDGFSDDI